MPEVDIHDSERDDKIKRNLEIHDRERDDEVRLNGEINEAILFDDKLKFVSLVNSMFSNSGTNTCPPYIWEMVCRNDALDCASAVLEGEFGLTVSLNVPIYGDYPLHLAAECASDDMVELFLRHGARTDVRITEREGTKVNLLPLNLAVERLSRHRYLVEWTPRQSIFKLILLLFLPQMKVPLEVCRLLAWNTKEVGDVFVDYVLGGKLIEMAALLMVAREKVMALRMFQSEDCSDLDGGMTIRDRIILEHVLLLEEVVKLMADNKNSKLVKLHKDKQAMMMNALTLLEVFERVGDRIETYIQSIRSRGKEILVKDIKALSEESGVFLKNKDIDLRDSDCDNIMPATERLETSSSYKSPVQSDSVPLYRLHPLSNGFCEEKRNPITHVKNVKSWEVPRFFHHESSMLCHDGAPMVQSLSKRTMHSQVQKNATTMESSVSLSSKRLAPILLALKRGIRRI